MKLNSALRKKLIWNAKGTSHQWETRECFGLSHPKGAVSTLGSPCFLEGGLIDWTFAKNKLVALKKRHLIEKQENSGL